MLISKRNLYRKLFKILILKFLIKYHYLNDLNPSSFKNSQPRITSAEAHYYMVKRFQDFNTILRNIQDG